MLIDKPHTHVLYYGTHMIQPSGKLFTQNNFLYCQISSQKNLHWLDRNVSNQIQSEHNGAKDGQIWKIIKNIPWLCAHQIRVRYPVKGMSYVWAMPMVVQVFPPPPHPPTWMVYLQWGREGQVQRSDDSDLRQLVWLAQALAAHTWRVGCTPCHTLKGRQITHK